jgi:hypothetical protein
MWSPQGHRPGFSLLIGSPQDFHKRKRKSWGSPSLGVDWERAVAITAEAPHKTIFPTSEKKITLSLWRMIIKIYSWGPLWKPTATGRGWHGGWTGQEWKLAHPYVRRRDRNTCEGHALCGHTLWRPHPDPQCLMFHRPSLMSDCGLMRGPKTPPMPSPPQ